ncbi:MAG: hypothetical protein H6606_01595 [Flavobacteriales bacterium]|nr:hypothetical protein [Flavobacteriales bacterium]
MRSDVKSLSRITLAIVFVLFFIDEGYYDLRWMKSFGNWILFGVYFVILLAPQLFFHRVVFKGYTGTGKIALSAIVGSALAMSSIYTLAAWLTN